MSQKGGRALDVFMEKGLCLERTKVGSGDKDEAYVVSRNQGAFIAGSIFIGFLVCAAAIIEFKAEMLTSVVNERRMERIAEMAEREEHRPEAKLMRVSARLEAHLIRDKQEKNHLKSYKASQANLLGRYQTNIKDYTNDKTGDALATAVISATESFHKEVLRLSEEHTKALHLEGEHADQRLRALRAEITGELTAGAAEAREDAQLAKYDGEHMATLDSNDPELVEVDRDQRVEAEKAVSRMLERFQNRLSEAKKLTPAATSKYAQWKKLEQDIEDGRVDFDEAEKTIKRELLAAHVPLPKDATSIHEYFAEVVEDLQMLEAKHDVMSTLNEWTAGTLTVHQTLLAIQKMVTENRVNPNWLIDPEATPSTK